ncbi:hypothetical protein TH0225_10660 [Helicobacter pylori]
MKRSYWNFALKKTNANAKESFKESFKKLVTKKRKTIPKKTRVKNSFQPLKTKCLLNQSF